LCDPPRIVSAVKVWPDGAKEELIAVGASLRQRSEIHALVERVQPDGSVHVVEIVPQVPRPDVWLNVALGDRNIADVLAIVGRAPVRWHDLFHVYEIILTDVGDAMYTHRWVTKAEVRRFTRTANSRRAIGREARHGHDRFDPPTKPLSLSEAHNMIVRMARQWLDEKVPPPPLREVIIERRPPPHTTGGEIGPQPT
jgi:hypothetical protein